MDIKSKITELNLKLGALTPNKRNLLLLTPPLVIFGLFIYFLIMPAFDEVKALNEEINNQKNEIVKVQNDLKKLPALKEENKRLERKLSELELKLPEEREVSGLLKQVSELGIKSGLQVVSWRPGNKNIHPSNEVYQIPVSVVMRGTYHKFGHFFSNITMLSRIVNIFNINMRPGSHGLDVSFTAMTYSKISEQEKKELQKKEAKKK